MEVFPMGYPMTFQRFLSRNRLKDGDYDAVPRSWMSAEGGAVLPGLSNDQLIQVVEFWKRHINEDAQDRNRRWRQLVGDLRRLEGDTVDESVVCRAIAAKSGVDAEVVAAVLKEWIAT